MAKKQLTIEEKLQAALVPVEEQPYKVPENWCWVRLGEVITASKEKQDVFDSKTKYVGLENIEKDTGIISYGFADEVKSTKSVFKCGDILYGKLRPYLNKHGVVDFDGVCSTDILVFNAIKGDNRLYDSYFSLPSFIEYTISNSKGINLPRVSEKVILAMPFPLAPQEEQSRIIARIESLFAKLDEAKEKIQEVLDGADLRRAAILHQAFTGKLTEKWRRENGVDFNDTWKKSTIVDLCTAIVDCPHSTPKWTKDGKICLRTTNIKDGYLDFTDVNYVSEKTYQDRVRRLIPQAGDVLLTREGNIGDVGVIPSGFEICLGQRMMLLRPGKCESNFLVYFFRNPIIKAEIKLNTMGSTAPRMNVKDLKKLSLMCPSNEEQQEIVRLLDNLLTREQSIVTACEEALTTIATLKKSILARAFRGELGTNDPAEPSAKELLREILMA